MKRKKLMQFHIKRKRVWCARTPALHHANIGRCIERRIDFHNFEMLRVPTEPFMRAHSFRIPACNKTGIRPTGRADQNFPGTRLMRSFFCHEKQETRLLPKANSVRARIWLRGRDLNSRPSGYEPDELPGCSTPRPNYADVMHGIKFKKAIADLRARSKVALAGGGGLRRIHAAQSGGIQNPA